MHLKRAVFLLLVAVFYRKWNWANAQGTSYGDDYDGVLSNSYSDDGYNDGAYDGTSRQTVENSSAMPIRPIRQKKTENDKLVKGRVRQTNQADKPGHKSHKKMARFKKYFQKMAKILDNSDSTESNDYSDNSYGENASGQNDRNSNDLSDYNQSFNGRKKINSNKNIGRLNNKMMRLYQQQGRQGRILARLSHTIRSTVAKQAARVREMKNSKTDTENIKNSINKLMCMTFHLNFDKKETGLEEIKNLVTCTISNTIWRKKKSFHSLDLKLVKEAYFDNILLSLKHFHVDASLFAYTQGVWEGTPSNIIHTATQKSYVDSNKDYSILVEYRVHFVPDELGCRGPGELKIVTEDHSGRHHCQREGILVHCTASNRSSPWHNFKSDTVNWRTADGSKVCTNEGGYLPWARQNAPFVKSMLAAGAVKILGPTQNVTLIGKPPGSSSYHVNNQSMKY